MKKIILFLLLFVTLCQSQILKVFWNDLYYIGKDSVAILKTLNQENGLQGYDIVDSLNIFLAYQDENYSEGLTIISVYNRKSGTENILARLVSTSSSIFLYNSEYDIVVYCSSDGFSGFKLHDAHGNIVADIEPFVIKKCKCSHPFWINIKTVGFFEYINDKWSISYETLDIK
jgi:hypothetical protein